LIGVLGGGQLARMLALAGYPLGERFVVLDPSSEAGAGHLADLIAGAYDDRGALDSLIEACGVVTYEFERVPAASARFVAERVPVRPGPNALEVSQDRLTEKELFNRHGLATPEFRPASGRGALETAIESLGLPVVVKTRREGYDGKGQVVVRQQGDVERALAELAGKDLLVETLVDFDRELSLLAVRSLDGDIAFYPLVENHHRDGILRVSKAPAPKLESALQTGAEAHARALVDELDYVGVIAIELLQVGDELLGNEMAPRVHNSGHWTIEGARTSQFENHIRAITGRPLGSTQAVGCSAMVNLIGDLPDLDKLLRLDGAHLHLYGKEPRPGRKLGHVTLVANDPTELDDQLDTVLSIVGA
jgi:5-(carboxyamino)imidazole ribonucleotide synthase